QCIRGDLSPDRSARASAVCPVMTVPEGRWMANDEPGPPLHFIPRLFETHRTALASLSQRLIQTLRQPFS
ncbi:MAG: hypothetical protein ACOC0P_07505, partial [Planctomycetota bacterium]